MNKFVPINRCNRGVSLVGIIVAMGIVGILGLVGNQIVKANLKAVAKLAEIREKEDVRNLIRVRTSCSESKKKNFKFLYDRDGNLIMEKSGGKMKVGNWRIEVKERDASTGELKIFAKKSGSTKKLLFNPVPFVCS